MTVMFQRFQKLNKTGSQLNPSGVVKDSHKVYRKISSYLILTCMFYKFHIDCHVLTNKI